MALALRRTTDRDPAFVALTRRLDTELRDRYGDAAARARAAHDDFITDHAVVALDGALAVGCGCFRRFDPTTIEVKRLYVDGERRGRGIGRATLGELEAWALELGYAGVVVEAGLRQPEAIELYEAAGYAVIDNYEPYVGMPASVCLARRLVRSRA